MTPAAVRLSDDDIIARVRDLPALPAVVIDLIRSLNECDGDGDRGGNFGIEQLARRIERDQALTARTLRLANSSFYGMPRRVTSIADAAALLGLRTLRSVAIAVGVVSGMRAADCAGFDFHAFWRHSIATALCAAAIAREQRFDEGSAFTAGLLHDIGHLVLASHFAAPYAEALRWRAEHDCPALEAERAVLGTEHAAIGRLIAEHWRFAPAIVDAIATHHAPQPPSANALAAAASLADIVHVADNMAHALDLSQHDDDLVPPLAMAAWVRLALDERSCFAVFEQVCMQHEAVCRALSS